MGKHRFEAGAANAFLYLLAGICVVTIRLNALAEWWCSRNFIIVNMIKTVILIFGKAPAGLQFRLGANNLVIVTKVMSVGMTFRTEQGRCLKYKASKYSEILGTQDCHLIHGCEVCPDSEVAHVKDLCHSG
jgi:hypothetical protein